MPAMPVVAYMPVEHHTIRISLKQTYVQKQALSKGNVQSEPSGMATCDAQHKYL